MPRKMIDPKGGAKDRPAPGDPKVECMQLTGATRLVTIGPDHEAWASVGTGKVVGLGPVEGAFVRLVPPAGTDAGTVSVVDAACSALGALAIKRVPAPSVAVVPRAAPMVHHSLREQVTAVVEAARTRDREKLRELVGESLDEGGV